MMRKSGNNVVVQKLNSLERLGLLKHLQRLFPEDRRLRFGSFMSDAALEHYVSRIDFASDKVFGIHARDLRIVGMAHLAFDPRHQSAELGLSVDPDERGKGYGLALLERGRLTAVNFGCRTLFMHCLSENQIMVHLAKKAGLKLVTVEGEVDARLALEPTSLGAIAHEVAEDQIALTDFLLKSNFAWLAGRSVAVA